MSVVVVVDQKGKKVKDLGLRSDFLTGTIHKGLVHECVRKYRAAQRQGNASSKTRGEVVGSGAKPWKQKGTGRARSGTRKSPIWRGGGVVFGPKHRSYNFRMPKKMKRLALLSSLRARFQGEQFIVVDQWDVASVKTKDMCAMLQGLNVSSNVLLVTAGKDDQLLKIVANLPAVSIRESAIVNALDVIRRKRLVLTEQAVLDLQERLQGVGGAE